MLKNFNDIYDKFKEKGLSRNYFMESSVTYKEEDSLIHHIKDINPPIKDCIEIGTYNGLSTIVLASVAKSVHTFDIAYRDAEFLWKELYPELRKKIHYTVGHQGVIDNQIQRLWFFNGETLDLNFAFIDGNHDYKSVKYDFGLVKDCGRVLFHDANIPEIKKFMDEIGADIYWSGQRMFALWEE